MKNKDYDILRWTSGEAEGLYIDFAKQEIGFRDFPAKYIEYKKIEILRFLIDHKGEYVNERQINQIEELNSVNLAKNVSSIKSAIKACFEYEYDSDKAEKLFASVISRHKVDGLMGYMLVMDGCSFETKEQVIPKATVEIPAPTPAPAVTTPSKTEDESYIKKNWLPLFVLAMVIIGLYLVCAAADLTVTDLMLALIKLPMPFILGVMVGMSVIPILAGMFIDSYPILAKHAKANGIRVKDMTPEEKRQVAMYDAGVFDYSKKHLQLFLGCNLTGAFCACSIVNYVRTLEGFPEFLAAGEHKIQALLIIAACIFVAWYNNYALQTKPSPARNTENFILTRAHAFYNTVYLSSIMSGTAFLMYGFVLYAIREHGNGIERINPAFCITILSAFAYLWFSSDSPLAEEFDAICNNNFIAGVPFVAVVMAAYAAIFFNQSSVLAFVLIAAIILVWALYIKKRKTQGINKVSRTFFSVVSVIVVILLGFGSFFG